MTVRPYRPDDRSAVERINYDTGLIGRSLEELGVSRRLVARGIAGYFDRYPEFVFVAEDADAGVVGYVFGEPGGARGHGKAGILLRILRNVCSLPLLPPADRRYVANQLRVVVNAALGRGQEGRFSMPSGAAELHINLLPGHRGRGTGRRLLDAFCARVRQEGATTVCAGSYLTGLNPNRGFWTGNGFAEYSRITSSVWKNVFPGETIYLVCYAKEMADA